TNYRRVLFILNVLYAQIGESGRDSHLRDLNAQVAEGAPRARGDDPFQTPISGVPQAVLPAHAGMILRVESCTQRIPSAPRARGDDPHLPIPRVGERECSPRTRG